MTREISVYCTNNSETEQQIGAWHASATAGKPYLMAEILQSALGIAEATKDSERLAPVVGRHLTALGMKNRRMRGQQGNRHYWIKA